jgi:hypothetical protein
LTVGNFDAVCQHVAVFDLLGMVPATKRARRLPPPDQIHIPDDTAERRATTDSSQRTRSIAARTPGSSRSSPSARKAWASSASTTTSWTCRPEWSRPVDLLCRPRVGVRGSAGRQMRPTDCYVTRLHFTRRLLLQRVLGDIEVAVVERLRAPAQISVIAVVDLFTL